MHTAHVVVAVSASLLALTVAACAPLPSQHRYAASDLKRHGCERVAPTGSRIKSATRCQWDRHPDSYHRREALSNRDVFTHPRERVVRPTGF